MNKEQLLNIRRHLMGALKEIEQALRKLVKNENKFR